MGPDWKLDGDATTKRMFSNFEGVDVVVSITGREWEKVRSAAAEVDARLSASLEAGRFSVLDLGVREALYALLAENRILSDNLGRVQARGTELISKARAWRKRLMELGDPDPGAP